jgi:CRISPR-associated endonuclease/helicase Cas3
MNLTVVPFCKTAQGTMLLDGAILEKQDEYKRLECMALNSVGVPKSWQHWFNEPEDGKYWLQMEQDGDRYSAFSKGVTFNYHKDYGLEKKK